MKCSARFDIMFYIYINDKNGNQSKVASLRHTSVDLVLSCLSLNEEFSSALDMVIFLYVYITSDHGSNRKYGS
jgi:hypothetical protein